MSPFPTTAPTIAYMVRGYAVISMIVPSNLSSVKELSADLRASSCSLLFKYWMAICSPIASPWSPSERKWTPAKLRPRGQGGVRGELVQLAYDRQVTLISPVVIRQRFWRAGLKDGALFGRQRQLLLVVAVRL